MDSISVVGETIAESAAGKCVWATLDFEASGLTQTSYPIEVGICINGTTPVSCLINPLTADDWTHWDTEAEGIHGLPREHVEQKGDPVTEVCQFLNIHLNRYEVVLCDSQWDLFWLGRLYRAAHMRPSFTLLEVNHWLSQQEKIDPSRYHDLFESLGPPKHRAAEDALQINHALQLLLSNTES